MEIILGRKGDQPFEITEKTVSGKHLKLTKQADGKVLVEDLGSANGTFIDGVRIIKKVVDLDTIVQMGPTYSFKIRDVIPAVPIPNTNAGDGARTPNAPTPPPPPQVKEYSIYHLEKVWENYNESLIEFKKRTKQFGDQRAISGGFTGASGALATIARVCEWNSGIFYISAALTAIGFIIMVYSVIQMKSFNFDQEKEKLDDQFIKDYVCPNPDCKHFLGFQRYSILKQNKNCPYCKCKHNS